MVGEINCPDYAGEVVFAAREVDDAVTRAYEPPAECTAGAFARAGDQEGTLSGLSHLCSLSRMKGSNRSNA
ncbi:hypothetical protein [Paraburkholderia strydomiana]|uniref:hypothetical protein n=1 Tax=Paraburkholderia strydomiana TaxID=1245417 RepID=UPI00285726C6|nr:hypothetical protein [Paraburkholderia strydomiana]MDR7009343.1 hypothetical protein [Paraburkholderia strydomiana]